jgi:cellulose synthase/poly-beta-1,6-N-acetylglucosamine synthase-like glycosyltransferase
MTNLLLSKIIYTLFLIFLGYFLLLVFYYFILTVIGLFEGKRRTLESESEDYPLTYLSDLAIPVSIVIPARNEEEWIRDSLLSVLNMNYPKFEVIVVDDGSTDKTFSVLHDILALKPVDIVYIKHYKDGMVREILKSDKYPNVTVIAKHSGSKKAGAVNAGLNLAKNEYVCVMDADTIMEPDALLKAMAQAGRDPERIIGIGSYFGLVNGLKIKDGRIIKRSFSWNPIVAYQNLEYIRSFFGNRIGWGKFNSIPVVAGGFGIWRRDILYALGGFSLDFTCEDIEMTFRVQDYMAKNKKKGYRILMLPYPVSWTEGPVNVRSLISQRSRWQRVTNETIYRYKYMFLNPKYGSFGFLTIPYYLLYEVLGVFVEVLSLVMVVVGGVLGILDIKTAFAFLALMLLSQAMVSLLSIFTFVRSQRVFSIGYVLYMMVLGFLEFFWYRWIISISKAVGMYTYARGVTSFEQYTRAKRTD